MQFADAEQDLDSLHSAGSAVTFEEPAPEGAIDVAALDLAFSRELCTGEARRHLHFITVRGDEASALHAVSGDVTYSSWA